MAMHNMTIWQDCIRAWYPDYETKCYFIPPVDISRKPFDVVPMAGQDAFVPQCTTNQTSSAQSTSPQVKRRRIEVQDSDTRGDVALQSVLFCLKELASLQKEPMFVLSQLKFSSCLGEPCYAAAAKHFIRSESLAAKYSDGDFDILVIHRKYGILTGEIKSVLSNQRQIQLSQKDKDQTIVKSVREAIEQLNKSEVILHEITKDLQPGLAIRKVLVLPYVTRSDLHRVLLYDRQLHQDLVSCLHVIHIVQAVEKCLLADDLPTHANEVVNMEEFKTWWSRFFYGCISMTNTSEIYTDLLARLCGPAMTVSIYSLTPPRIVVRTEGQGASNLGRRMMSLVLTPEQIGVLNRAPAKVMLIGPPGVGKSVTLVLMALKWLREGHDVQILNICIDYLAAAYMIYQMLQMSMSNILPTQTVMGSVYLLDFDCYCNETDVFEASIELAAVQEPHIICNEFIVLTSSKKDPLNRLIKNLCFNIPSIKFWAASANYLSIPKELQAEVMTIPLRYPQAVLMEVKKGVDVAHQFVYNYTTPALPSPGDGTRVIYLSHKGPVHKKYWPLECDKCGQSIAGILKLLGVGMTGSNPSCSRVIMPNMYPSLQYRDVFILTEGPLNDDTEDDTSVAHGVVRGLRDEGIPTHVIRTEHLRSDLRVMMEEESDTVTLATMKYVYGLERKVVVVLPATIPSLFHEFISDEQHDSSVRLSAMSRCTAQLIVIDAPLFLLESRHHCHDDKQTWCTVV